MNIVYRVQLEKPEAEKKNNYLDVADQAGWGTGRGF